MSCSYIHCTMNLVYRICGNQTFCWSFWSNIKTKTLFYHYLPMSSFAVTRFLLLLNIKWLSRNLNRLLVCKLQLSFQEWCLNISIFWTDLHAPISDKLCPTNTRKWHINSQYAKTCSNTSSYFKHWNYNISFCFWSSFLTCTAMGRDPKQSTFVYSSLYMQKVLHIHTLEELQYRLWITSCISACWAQLWQTGKSGKRTKRTRKHQTLKDVLVPSCHSNRDTP